MANTTINIDQIYIFMPFAIYGMYKLAKWWLKMVWQMKTDCLTAQEGWFPIVETVAFSIWVAATLMLLEKKIDFYMLFPYILLTFIGPISEILGLAREYGFGYTNLGKKLGCYPPTKEEKVNTLYANTLYSYKK